VVRLPAVRAVAWADLAGLLAEWQSEHFSLSVSPLIERNVSVSVIVTTTERLLFVTLWLQ
jgi:hypothetical protein